jgi:hypothetical protein
MCHDPCWIKLLKNINTKKRSVEMQIAFFMPSFPVSPT